MAGPNLKMNSLNEVVSTVTHMLNSFETFVRQEMSDINVAYDHELSYDTGLENIIVNNNFNGQKKRPDPLLIYNRTITEDSQHGIASRARNTTGYKKIGDHAIKYSCAYSEYDLNFLYVTHDVRKQESFEVAYNSNTGLSACRELTVDMGELGEFKYFLTPLPLTEVTFVESGTTYKAIGGTMRVRGFFFVFEGESSIIKEITAKIYASKDAYKKEESEVVGEINILGEP